MEEFKKLYDEAQKMSKEELVKDALPRLVGLLDKAKEIGFSKVLNEFPDINDFLQSKLREFEPEEAINIIKELIPIIYNTVVDFVAQSEEIQDELEDVEDTSIAMALEDGDFAMTIAIKAGEFKYEMGIMEGADVILKMDKETMQKFMSGEENPMSAFMSGAVKVEGNLGKVMALRPILEIVGEELGIDIMIFQ